MGMDTETINDTDSYCYWKVGSRWIFSAPIPANDDPIIWWVHVDNMAHTITYQCRQSKRRGGTGHRNGSTKYQQYQESRKILGTCRRSDRIYLYPFAERRGLIVAATCYLMYHELDAFVRIRQDNLTAEDHKFTVRATTILVTSIPKNFLDVNTLRQVFSVFPGGVKNVFLNRDCKDLLDKIQERDDIAKMLESAETELIVKANKIARKQKQKKEKEAKKSPQKNPEENVAELDVATSEHPDKAHGGRQEGAIDFECLVDKYVPKKKRPTHRLPLASWLPSLPLIGKKVSPLNSGAEIGRYGEVGKRGVDQDEPRHRTTTSPS